MQEIKNLEALLAPLPEGFPVPFLVGSDARTVLAVWNSGKIPFLTYGVRAYLGNIYTVWASGDLEQYSFQLTGPLPKWFLDLIERDCGDDHGAD